MVELLKDLIYSKDVRVAKLATHLQKAHDSYQQGLLTKEEFTTLIEMIESSQVLIDESIALEFRSDLAVCITNFLSLVRTAKSLL